MAFDKAVDSTALNAGLTKIADAIRAKGGTEGAMAFPDGFAEMIEAIQAGGGGNFNIPGSIEHFAIDTYVQASYAQEAIISHSLGVVPVVGIIVMADDNYIENSFSYPYSRAGMISLGPAQAYFIAQSDNPLSGDTVYSNLSCGKRNSLQNHTESTIKFSGSNTSFFVPGEYVVITMR